MPKRYTLFEIEKLSDRFKVKSGTPSGVKKSYNISPTQLSPIVINHDGLIEIKLAKWGFIPKNAKNTNAVFRYKTFEAKSESIYEKPTWEHAIRHSRCLVPANGYFEWLKENNQSIPYFIQPIEPHLFSFAGIYSSWQDIDGKEWTVFSIVTTEATRDIKYIDQRMPVILHPLAEETWLDPSIRHSDKIIDIMDRQLEDTLQVYPVSDTVHSVKINKPELIKPISKL